MALTSWTLEQIRDQLMRDNTWIVPADPSTLTLTYAFPATAQGLLADATIISGFSTTTEAQRPLARLAFRLWDDLVPFSIGEISSSADAKIHVSLSTHTSNGDAITFWRASPPLDQADIWLNSNVSNLVSPTVGNMGFETYLHEIGHALGLNHMGNYDGQGDETVPSCREDSMIFSLMSYFGPSGPLLNPEAMAADWSDTNSLLIDIAYFAQTPMLNDIDAIQQLYGASTTTRLGNTTYGFNCNINDPTRSIYDFVQNRHPVLCLYDSNGVDTLDLSGWGSNSFLSLESGKSSSASNLTNNIWIARNTVIENGVTGDGNDTLQGNAFDNTLSSADGNDSAWAYAGNDRLVFGSGGDELHGGTGNDNYVVSRVDYDPPISINVPTYDISDSAGRDTLTIADIPSPFDLNGIDDLSFRAVNNDLWIKVDVQTSLGNDTDDGQIIIHNQSVLGERIETLTLLNDDGHQVGPAIALSSVWSALLLHNDNDWHRLELSESIGVDGALVIGLSGNAQGSPFVATGNYDLMLALDAANLSNAAYLSGTPLANELMRTGWSPISSAGQGLLDAGGGLVADGVPGSGQRNAYAFAAQRELPDNVVQFGIAFRGSNSPTDEWADWGDNNGAKFGFSYYYQQFQPVMAEMLSRALAAKASGKEVQILITGHSLGGAAAQAAMADLLLAPGKDLWQVPASESAPLDAVHRIYTNSNLAGHAAEIRALIDDTQTITFAAPSLLVDPNKPDRSDMYLLGAAARVGGTLGATGVLAYTIADALIVDPARSFNADTDELARLRTSIFQYEHEDSSLARGGDPVASIGTADPGLTFDINLSESLHDRYEDLSGQTDVALHNMTAYRESLARAVSGAPLLKSPNALEATTPLLPVSATGTAGNDFIVALAETPVNGGAGNDILVAGPNAGNFYLNGGAGVDTYVIREDAGVQQHGSQRVVIDGPVGEAVDHLVFQHVGTVWADVNGDNVNISLSSPTLDNPMVAHILGWYSGTVPFQVASIGQILPTSAAYWQVQNISFRSLGIPYYLTGTDQNDEVLGSHLDDAQVVGGLGDDAVDGREGNDTLYGDQVSSDVTVTAGGSDRLSGSSGMDILYGGGGNDNLNGGTDGDILYGGTGDDLLDGGSGNDQDILYGNDGNDKLVARGGPDRLYGGAGNDLYSVEGTDNAWALIDDAGSGSDTVRVRAPGADYTKTTFQAVGPTLQVRINDAAGSVIRSLDINGMANAAGRIEILEIDQGTAGTTAVGRYDLNVA